MGLYDSPYSQYGDQSGMPLRLSRLKGTHERAARILSEHAATVARIKRAPRLEAGADARAREAAAAQVRAELAVARREARAALAELRASVEADAQGAHSTLSGRLYAGTPKDDAKAVLHQLQVDAAWKRAEARLQAALTDRERSLDGQVEALAKDAVASGDHVTLAALRRELPSFCATHGQDVIGPIAMRALDRTAAQVTRESREALAQRDDLERGMLRVRQTLAQTEHALRDGWGSSPADSDSVLLPRWEDGVVTVPLVAPDPVTSA